MTTPELTDPTVDLVDPQSAAFWAGDPSILPEPAPTPAEPEPDPHARVHHEIAAAILVLCALVARALLHRRPADPAQAQATARSAWAEYAPMWLRLAVPAVRQAFLLGQVSGLDPEQLQALATHYATGLGDYLDESSAEALADGFSRQLGSRWSEGLAWHRAATAYGLDKRQMRSYVQGLMAGTDAGRTDPVPAIARALVDKALMARADRLGAEESYSAAENGKALAWMFLYRAGHLPASARREWHTAEDESVCPTCAPLDHQLMPLDEPFRLADGSTLWSPRAHPGCHCHIGLVDTEPVAKNVAGDAYNRNPRGEFARREGRTLTLRPVPSEPLPTPAAEPISLLSGQPSLLGQKSLLGQRGLLGQRSLLEQTSLLGQESLLGQQQAVAQRQRMVLRITLPANLRPLPSPPPGRALYVPESDIAGYQGTQDFDKATNGLVPFDAIKEYYQLLGVSWAGIAATEYDTPWASVYPQVEGHSDEEWADMLTAAKPVWHAAMTNAEDVLYGEDALEDSELHGIASRAFRPNMTNAEDIRRAILADIDDDSDPDHNWRDAYADYVTFIHPELTGVSHEVLQGFLEQYPLKDVMEAEPPTTLRIAELAPEDEGLQAPTRRAGDVGDLTGRYTMTGGRYLSALAEGVSKPGHLNLREVELQPEQRRRLGE